MPPPAAPAPTGPFLEVKGWRSRVARPAAQTARLGGVGGASSSGPPPPGHADEANVMTQCSFSRFPGSGGSREPVFARKLVVAGVAAGSAALRWR